MKKARFYFANGRVKGMIVADRSTELEHLDYRGRRTFKRTGDTYNGARVYREVE